MSALSERLATLTRARKAHEAVHGRPDDYTGVTINEATGRKMRLHAYTESWNRSYSEWDKAYRDVFGR